MSRQLELLEKLPRRKPRKLMHVCDAGDDCAKFHCGHCGYTSAWLYFETVTEAKRGIPCPQCNVGCD